MSFFLISICGFVEYWWMQYDLELLGQHLHRYRMPNKDKGSCCQKGGTAITMQKQILVDRWFSIHGLRASTVTTRRVALSNLNNNCVILHSAAVGGPVHSRRTRSVRTRPYSASFSVATFRPFAIFSASAEIRMAIAFPQPFMHPKMLPVGLVTEATK